jgi:hypothetical protein
MSGPRTWQAEAQRPHQAVYEDIARRKQQAFDDAVATRAAARAVDASQGAPSTATLTKEAAIAALKKANDAVEAAEQELQRTKAAEMAQVRQCEAWKAELAKCEGMGDRERRARVDHAMMSPGAEFIMPAPLGEAIAARDRAVAAAKSAAQTLEDLQGKRAADEAALQKALAARLRAKGLRVTVDAAEDDRRLTGLQEELADIRERQRARRDIASFDGAIPQALASSTSRAVNLELEADHRITPEQYLVIQGNYRRPQNAQWKALDVDPAAELAG